MCIDFDLVKFGLGSQLMVFLLLPIFWTFSLGREWTKVSGNACFLLVRTALVFIFSINSLLRLFSTNLFWLCFIKGRVFLSWFVFSTFLAFGVIRSVWLTKPFIGFDPLLYISVLLSALLSISHFGFQTSDPVAARVLACSAFFEF